jgi:hypothetical protein
MGRAEDERRTERARHRVNLVPCRLHPPNRRGDDAVTVTAVLRPSACNRTLPCPPPAAQRCRPLCLTENLADGHDLVHGTQRPGASTDTDEDCNCDPVCVNRGARLDPGGTGGGTVHRRHRRAGGGVATKDGGVGRQ